MLEPLLGSTVLYRADVSWNTSSELSSRLFTFSSLLLSRLELSDTTICEPYVRAILGTASHFCPALVLKLRTVLLGKALNLIMTVQAHVTRVSATPPQRGLVLAYRDTSPIRKRTLPI